MRFASVCVNNKINHVEDTNHPKTILFQRMFKNRVQIHIVFLHINSTEEEHHLLFLKTDCSVIKLQLLFSQTEIYPCRS